MLVFSSLFIFLYTSIIIFILGCVAGSFLTCVATRVAEDKDWISARSECDMCHHELGFLDLIPIVSYLINKGRCRYCKEKLSPIYPLSELLCGLNALLLLYVYDLSIYTFIYFIFGCVLYFLSVVDLKIYEIPDTCHIVSIVLWIILILFTKEYKDGLLGGFVIAGVMIIVSIIMDNVLKKESLGGGDIKLLFVTGLYLGLMGNLFCLFFACIFGLIYAYSFSENKVPFGPSISLACWFMIIFGHRLVELYLGLF